MTLATSDVDRLTADEARDLTDRIRIRVAVDVTWALVAEAYTRQAHKALGYVSWDDYCTREFGTSRLRLPREERQEVVASLRESGLSIRAIAEVAGVDPATVHRDLGSGVANATPDEEDDVYVSHPCDVDPETGEIVDRNTQSTVLGKDGKTYSREPKNLSRTRAAIEERWRRVAEMAEAGYSSRQIADELGFTLSGLRDEARRRGITIAADQLIGKTRIIDSDRVIDDVVQSIADTAFSLTVVPVRFDELDRDRLDEWVSSLSDSLRSLTTLRNNLKKELTP